MSEIRLRAATGDDCRLVFDWANDPETRANSATTGEIPWDAHERWYADKLADPRSEIWIAEDESGRPLGQVRFDVDEDEAEIGVSVAPEGRGAGVGTALIVLGTADAARRLPVARIVAHIRHHNVASRRAFEKAGYRPDGEALVRGVTMLRYVRPVVPPDSV